MRRQYARWSFFFYFVLCISLNLLSADGFAESPVAKCLDARLYWETLAKKLDPHADIFLLDQAAMSLYVRGKSFGVRSFRNQERENGNMISAATTFRGVVTHRDEFVPKFQDRLKELSHGKAELISIPPEEAGIKNPASDSSYFKLIRQTTRGVIQSFVKLTQ
jgi:hypothetical protein